MPLPLIASLHPQDDPPTDTLPIGINDRSLWVAVPWVWDPELQVGAPLQLTLRPRGGVDWSAPCTVAERVDAWDAVEFRLTWIQPDRVRLSMPGSLRDAVQTSAQWYGAQPRVHLPDAAAVVLDLAPTSMTLAVPLTESPGKDKVWGGQIALQDKREPFGFHARVQQVRSTDTEHRVTLAFAGTDRAQQRVADRINAWLLARRRRDLRRAG